MRLLSGVAADRSRIAKQLVGLVLDRSGGTTQTLAAGWKNVGGVARHKLLSPW